MYRFDTTTFGWILVVFIFFSAFGLFTEHYLIDFFNMNTSQFLRREKYCSSRDICFLR